MPLSVSSLVLRARQIEIEGLQHLAARVDLAGVIGELIHAMQHERGTTSLHLASGGQRFAVERQAALAAVRPLEARLAQLFEASLTPGQGASARTLSLMAWVQLDLNALQALRAAVDQLAPSAHDAVAGFSRVIAGLVELIFHLADGAPDPAITRLLVALVHLVQGKEAAGQERAVGAQLLASGQCDDTEQQRIVQLIDAQEHALNVFAESGDADLQAAWQQQQLSPSTAQLERLRRTLCMARPGAALDTTLSEPWFDACSERIAGLWQLESTLVQRLREACAARIAEAQQQLQDSEGLLRQLRDNPPPHAHAVDRFFASPDAGGAAPVLAPRPGATAPAASAAGTVTGAPTDADPAAVSALKGLLQEQSARMARMEAELDGARRTLQDRKIIERAKGALMSRLGMNEEAAFRMLQKASMDHNRKLVEVAEAMLALPEAVFNNQVRR